MRIVIVPARAGGVDMYDVSVGYGGVPQDKLLHGVGKAAVVEIVTDVLNVKGEVVVVSDVFEQPLKEDEVKDVDARADAAMKKKSTFPTKAPSNS